MKKLTTGLLLLLLCSCINSFAQLQVKKVMFQGFWWNYSNSNFKNKWADYLTELAPRLRMIGIDGIWIPPSVKCGATSNNGYGSFDHYDLGDKYQKGGTDSLNVRTKLGTKDELLRMVAVMHANGIEVIQDVVLNHTQAAGTNNGTGGRDPEPNYSIVNANGYKNFRFVSYATPLLDESEDDYWTRNGRWPRNFSNFYPNQYNNCTTGDICTAYFGPDISYESSAYGRSTNIPTSGSATIGSVTRPYINPTQTADYMLNRARSWLTWLKKQTGVDGWRWDAVKHFPLFVQEDLIYTTKYNISAFAKGGDDMFCVAEWIGTKSEIDAYVTNVRSGNEEHTGTFDFNLRGYGANGGLYSMVLGKGNFNMQVLPGEQQSKRYYDYTNKRVHRTVPFVNSHDTYRPILSADGNFSKPLGDATGWNTGSELGGNGQHIDPREPRLFAAYATIFAMDGNPIVFFEDLFDIGTTGKRYSHLPGNVNDLPVRPDLQNIIQAHQKLGFKEGKYAVLTSATLTGSDAPSYQKGGSGDHLVLERKGQAIVGITDRFSAVDDNSDDEEVWVSVSDASWNNVLLIDYSGAHGLTTSRVRPDGRVLIKTAPVGHTIAGARGHGYSIWAPIPAGVTFTTINDLYDYLATYQPGRSTSTTQEWEMADDLGDSHPKSLQQGGQLPANSTDQRTAGKIFPQATSTVTVRLYPQINGSSQHISIYNSTNQLVSEADGVSNSGNPLVLTYTPSSTEWYTIRVNNSTDTQAAQKVWVNVTYTAPVLVDTRNSNLTTGVNPQEFVTTNAKKGFVFPNPTTGSLRFYIPSIRKEEIITVQLFQYNGNMIRSFKNRLSETEQQLSNVLSATSAGLYFIRLIHKSGTYQFKVIRQ